MNSENPATVEPEIVQEPQPVALERANPAPSDLLAKIAEAVTNPDLDVAKMERLLAMHKEIVMAQRQIAFDEALARLQAKLPQIEKDGRIVVKGVERSRYALTEDIDVAIRPLLAEEGFSLSFDTESNDAKLFKISCKMTHKQGHSETKRILLPLDVSIYRSEMHNIASTISFGRRQLIKMHLNLVEKGESEQAGMEPISEDQLKDLEALLVEVKADKKKFLIYMGVENLEEIRRRDHLKAINALEAKRRK